MLTDTSAYRVETGEAAKSDHDAVSAIANFGDKETAITLGKYFQDLRDYLLKGRNAARLNFKAGVKFQL